MEIPSFGTKSELFEFLVQNKERIITHKKTIVKHADGIALTPFEASKGQVIKENNPVKEVGNQLKVKVVINTTNLMDSHYDVHIPGLWNKSLQENNMLMHLQEHKMTFDKIISDGEDLSAYVKNFNWSEIGFDYPGQTQALIFESNIKRDRNEYMLKQYAEGRVKNHSVGMRYVKLVLAINDESYGAEFEAWEKYFPQVANKEMAESIGYFWAVKEAKAIEGSAVPIGSNIATPTLENNIKFEPSQGTQTKEAGHTTSINNQLIYNHL